VSPSPILVAYPDPGFREHLTSALSGAFPLEFVPGHVEALHYLEQQRPLALLVDPSVRPPADEDAVRIAGSLYPDLPVALISSTSTSECFSFLTLYGVGAAIPPNVGLSPSHLKLFFQHLIDPASLFSLKNYVSPGREVCSERITVPNARTRVFELLTRDFEPCKYVNTHDLQLVFEEVLNNAIFHAFRTEKNEPKYTSSDDEPFDLQDQIVLEWGIGEDYSVVAITDNQGLLSRRTIWDRFTRQINLTGLLDTNGRGIFLTHLLSKLVLITVRPGLHTRVAVFFGPGSTKQPKPIGIQVVQDRLQA
jgi:anti-sigma regulatory factor (Ser/Thr protein kinase)